MISKNHYLLGVLVLLFFVPLVKAVPPFYPMGQDGGMLDIEYPKFEYYDIAQPVTLYFHVYNYTGQLQTNQTTYCYIHTYNQSNHIFAGSLNYSQNNIDFYHTLNLSKYSLGVVQYVVSCNTTTGYAGFLSTSFGLVNKGTETNTNDLTGLIISLTIFGSVLLIGGILLLVRVKKEPREAAE